MKKIVLCVSGKMRVGKNEFANCVQKEFEKHNFTVKQDSFAQSVKTGCNEDFQNLSSELTKIANEIHRKFRLYADTKNEMFNASSIDDIEKSIGKLIIRDENWFEKKTDLSRILIQTYGTDIFRKRVDEDWWVNKLKDKVIQSPEQVVIITDCRYPNEIEHMFADEFDTITIRIDRTINSNKDIHKHDSEISLDDFNEWDYRVDNNSTVKGLKESAFTIAEDIIFNRMLESSYDFGLIDGISINEREVLKQLI